jgi:type III pantothenate kinase
VVDFGTAISIEAVSGRGEFLGGAIACGVSLAARALHERTALLPLIDVRPPRRAIGRSTVEALQSGIVLGAAGAVRHLVDRIKLELQPPVAVYATGSDAQSLVQTLGCFDKIIPGLALEGIQILHQQRAERLRR